MPLPRFGGVTLCATNRGRSGGLTTNVSQPVPTLEGCRNDRWQMQKRDTRGSLVKHTVGGLCQGAIERNGRH